MTISDLAFSSAQNPATEQIRREDAEVKNAETARQGLADEFDEFMLLFTTQLQNQDPTDPLDTNEATAQLVQFTGVEQAVETNSLLEDLISLNSSSQTDSAVNYIGRFVETDGNQGILRNGDARFAYDLPAATNSASITVLDAAGRPVHTQTVEGVPGSYTYNWDGVNSFDGTNMNDGIYQFAVTARDINNETLEATTFTSGLVTSVSLESGAPVMTIDGSLDVGVDSILSVVGFFGDGESAGGESETAANENGTEIE
jgi:flagellar basal-body rod modification protein FlgD